MLCLWGIIGWGVKIEESIGFGLGVSRKGYGLRENKVAYYDMKMYVFMIDIYLPSF
jgi:hypothetical protein